MKRKVRLLPAAGDDLARLAAFLAEKSPQAAARAATKIAQSIRSLDEFAERGRCGPGRGLRELFVPFGLDAYVIQYRVDTDTVIVARIFHSRENRRWR